MRLALFRTVDDSELTLNQANFNMVFWALDRNDRIYFQEFTQRVNNAWEQHTIPIGPRAPQSLYNSRIDELVPFFGHKLPNFDFFLPEREFTGVQFDWRQVKGMGWFYKDSYDPQGLYATSIFSFWQQLTQFAQQGFAQFVSYWFNRLTGKEAEASTDLVVDHATLGLDELHFDKELYALSSKTAVTTEPRVILERDETQDDYLDATAKSQAIDARKQFFPQFWFMRARGDVRMKLGERFIVTGPRVPSPGSLELVCAEVKHIIDSDGYFMEVFGIRKFVLP